MGGCSALADSAWRRLQLPVQKPWSMMGGTFVCFLAQMGVETLLSPCSDSTSEEHSGQRLTTECSLISGCVKGH